MPLECRAFVHSAASWFVVISAVGEAGSTSDVLALKAAASRSRFLSTQCWHFHLRFLPLFVTIHVPPLYFWFCRQFVQKRSPVIVCAACRAFS